MEHALKRVKMTPHLEWQQVEQDLQKARKTSH